MKTCPKCGTANETTGKFCKQCGLRLDAPEPPVEKTVLAGPGARRVMAAAAAALPRNVSLTTLFAGKGKLVVGRAPDCDVHLNHPMVSRYHARLERQPDGRLHLIDLVSANGTWLNGRPLRGNEPVAVTDGVSVGIGPFLFTLRGGVIQIIDSSRSLRLEARGLEKIVPTQDGGSRKLLDDVNIVVEPGEFVSILGPSGCGKSTLMDALNGRRRATGGQVLANGEDFYSLFDNFRQSLGYVPQKDIVHFGLTVYKALYYTARLRLPTDTSPSELKGRVEHVLREMELQPHRDTLVGNLSGGQIKRVSLGAELLAQPALLYIDEATSGLDAGTEARMMKLFRRLADEGRSVLCITHNVDNVEQCHLVVVLARGKLMYYGPPGEAPAYFKVRRISDIYDRLGERDLAEWEKDFRASGPWAKYVQGRLDLSAPAAAAAALGAAVKSDAAAAAAAVAAGTPPPGVADSHSRLPMFPNKAESFRQGTSRVLRWRVLFGPLMDGWHQFRVVARRSLDLTLGDKRGLRFLLLQAPVVALCLLLGFLDKHYDETYPKMREVSEDEKKMLEAINGLEKVVYAQDGKDPQKRKEALDNMLFEVTVKQGDKETPMSVTGTQALALLKQLEFMKFGGRKAEYRDARLTFKQGDQEHRLTQKELEQALLALHEADLTGSLLEISNETVPGGGHPEIIPTQEKQLNPRYTYILLFIIVLVVMWFGSSNASLEIVKEEAIYSRERAVNLGITPYLASKFLLLTAQTVFQAALLMLLMFGTLEAAARLAPGRFSTPPAEYMTSYGATMVVLTLLSMAGVAMGLLLSALVTTPAQASTLLPYFMIPQMVFGGAFLPVNEGVIHWIAAIGSPVYWAFRAVHLGANTLPRGQSTHVPYADDVWLPCEVLLVQTLVLLLLTAYFLKRKEA
jgi:ABC-type multidrug transport system ATPase subunit